MDVQVKEEPLWVDYSDGVSEAAVQAALYTEHEIKEELVVGPEVIQLPDILQPKTTENNNKAQTETNKVPHSLKKSNMQDATYDCWLKKHICKNCNEYFEHQYQLKRHQCTHATKPSRCTVCGKQFKHESSLNSHKSVHVTVRPFSCRYCLKTFKLKGTLTTHERMHTGDKPYICKICDREFTQQTSLNNHKLLHKGIKPYPCPNCHQKFTQISNLQQHLSKYHPDNESSIFSKKEDTYISKPVLLKFKNHYTTTKS